jgi:pimeloyl-ACP methyl ester carboxylesterase
MTTSAAGPARATSNTLVVAGVEMFYLDTAGNGPPVVLLHGLSANANSFGGIIAAGNRPSVRFIAPDLRGRARSGKPEHGYEMADHARDVIALLDELGLESVVLGGHSFGGYLAIYIAATYPERVSKLVIIDAAISSHPRIGVLLKPSLDRLTRIAASPEAYLAEIRGAAYLNDMWDDSVESYFRAEILENEDGTAQSATSGAAIAQAAMGVATEPWLHHVQQVRQPTLLLNAVEPFGPPGTPPLFDEVSARATARAFANARYVVIPGNHITLLFGQGASAVRREIEHFVNEKSA